MLRLSFATLTVTYCSIDRHSDEVHRVAAPIARTQPTAPAPLTNAERRLRAAQAAEARAALAAPENARLAAERAREAEEAKAKSDRLVKLRQMAAEEDANMRKAAEHMRMKQLEADKIALEKGAAAKLEQDRKQVPVKMEAKLVLLDEKLAEAEKLYAASEAQLNVDRPAFLQATAPLKANLAEVTDLLAGAAALIAPMPEYVAVSDSLAGAASEAALLVGIVARMEHPVMWRHPEGAEEEILNYNHVISVEHKDYRKGAAHVEILGKLLATAAFEMVAPRQADAEELVECGICAEMLAKRKMVKHGSVHDINLCKGCVRQNKYMCPYCREVLP